MSLAVIKFQNKHFISIGQNDTQYIVSLFDDQCNIYPSFTTHRGNDHILKDIAIMLNDALSFGPLHEVVFSPYAKVDHYKEIGEFVEIISK